MIKTVEEVVQDIHRWDRNTQIAILRGWAIQIVEECAGSAEYTMEESEISEYDKEGNYKPSEDSYQAKNGIWYTPVLMRSSILEVIEKIK